MGMTITTTPPPGYAIKRCHDLPIWYSPKWQGVGLTDQGALWVGPNRDSWSEVAEYLWDRWFASKFTGEILKWGYCTTSKLPYVSYGDLVLQCRDDGRVEVTDVSKKKWSSDIFPDVPTALYYLAEHMQADRVLHFYAEQV